MTEHYFSQKPQSKSSPMTWNYTLRGKDFTFTSDVGVFSKKEIDFGTRLLIDTFEIPETQGDILDLGCGYGPIGISIADSAPDRKIVMADVNERALQLAEENSKMNGVHNVEFVQSDRFSNLEDRRFAVVLTNPPIRAGKSVVHGMFEGSEERLLKGGELWVVIQKKQGAPSAIEKLESLFGNCETVERNKGYYILRSIKD
ncbi:class I SAM-dependent methyltransferase [Ornithinibacillus scapharcae]|uniref:class I SAM-dependent methyltransferase n=1 Tax=Ornithinibacillus scapharcae TaxID=1147159 RepID=UPI000225B855|nr:class I SAM-dependent methyltransferase [Ornithinibacillus scapharcae]